MASLTQRAGRILFEGIDHREARMTEKGTDSAFADFLSSIEDSELREDLSNYENPEVLGDNSLPQIFKLHLATNLLPSDHPVVRAEIDGELLRTELVETMFWLFSRDPETVQKVCQKEGVKDFAGFRAKMESLPRFEETSYFMWLFFIRNFPKLLSRLYAIAVESSTIAFMLHMWRDSPDENSEVIEVGTRRGLEQLISILEKDLKRAVEVRPKGRPLGRGKPAEKRAQEATEFERRIEEAIRTLLSVSGEMPTKTAVAKELRIGGVNPATGIDSSLNSFNNKLRRLEIDYDAIVERVRLNK